MIKIGIMIKISSLESAVPNPNRNLNPLLPFPRARPPLTWFQYLVQTAALFDCIQRQSDYDILPSCPLSRREPFDVEFP